MNQDEPDEKKVTYEQQDMIAKSKPAPLMFRWRIVEAAAKAHPDWEWLGEGHLRKLKIDRSGPQTPEELEAWFVKTYPEEAARLQADAERLERKMFGDKKH